MYKDMLYNEYKHRCIVGLRTIIIIHAVMLSIALIDFFLLKETSIYTFIAAYIFSIFIYILAANEDYMKMKCISEGKYKAITVTCIGTKHTQGRHNHGYFAYYSYKYEAYRARTTRKFFNTIQEGDRILLVSFDAKKTILILRDDIHPIP